MPLGVLLLERLANLSILQHTGYIIFHKLGKCYADLMNHKTLGRMMDFYNTLHAVKHSGQRDDILRAYTHFIAFVLQLLDKFLDVTTERQAEKNSMFLRWQAQNMDIRTVSRQINLYIT